MPSLPRLLLALLTALPLLGDWPEWRGPGGEGHSTAKGLPTSWSDTENVAWKTPLPGRAWSSPVVQGDQVWLTTAIETVAEPEDAARRLKENTGDQPLTLLESVELRALCVDRRTGRVLHSIPLFTEKEPQWVHELNSYASPTPVLGPGRAYFHFGTFGTACIDTRDARVLWTNTSLHIMHENGPGSSPVLIGRHLVFHLDGSDTQSIAALDADTGALAWRTSRSGELAAHPQLRKSYATPNVVKLDGKDAILSQGADWLYAYDPADGRELWKLKYGNLGFSLSSRAVTGHGMVFLATGYMRSEIQAIRLQGRATPVHAWKYAKGAPTMSSPLLVGDELYFVSDSGGMLTCLDAKTGTEHYRERIGGSHSASPILADGLIFLPSREGATSVVAPGKTFRLVAKNTLPGKQMATPAAVGDSLFLRTDSALYRLGVSTR